MHPDFILFAENNMANRKLTNIEKEKLISSVQNYPNLYNKTHAPYKDTRVQDNSWNEIQEECNFTGKMR